MAEEEQKKVRVAVAITGNTPLPPPEAANFFHFTVVGPEIQFLIGSVNLLHVHEAKGQTEMPTIAPEITHRFLLSSFGFAQLRRQISEIEAKVPALPSGMLTTSGHE